MKTAIFKILFCLLIVNFSMTLNFSQTNGAANVQTNQTVQTDQNAEVLGENERLPFMPNEKSADAAETGSGGLLLKTLGAMFLIVGLIFFGAWTLKKFGFGNSNLTPVENAPELAILSTISAGSNRTLSIVRFGARTLLIGSTAQSFTLLADEGNAEPPVLPQARSVADLLAEEKPDFNKEFARATANYDERREIGGRIS